VLLHLAHAGFGRSTSAATGRGLKSITVLRSRYRKNRKLLFYLCAGAVRTIDGSVMARNDPLEAFPAGFAKVFKQRHV